MLREECQGGIAGLTLVQAICWLLIAREMTLRAVKEALPNSLTVFMNAGPCNFDRAMIEVCRGSTLLPVCPIPARQRVGVRRLSWTAIPCRNAL